MPESALAAADATSFDSDIDIAAAHAVDATTVLASVTFVSLQAADKGPDGDTCDAWSLDYTMIEAPDGSWHIDSTAATNGSNDHVSCS